METEGPDAPLSVAPLGSNFPLKEFLKKRTEAKACEKARTPVPGVVPGVPAEHKCWEYLAGEEGRSSQRASPSYRAF
jgi:hypothetical protein